MPESTTDELREEAPEADVKMTIWEHLGELRNRVVRAVGGLIFGAVLCWIFKERLLEWLTEPYRIVWAERFPGIPFELQTLGPADVLIHYMQLSLVGGVVIGAPIIFYQLWAFVSPGLYDREKKYIIPFVLFSTLLFLSGVAFAYYVAFPFSSSYFVSLLGPVGDSGVMLTSRPTMEFYMDFVTRMLLAFGFVFELPLFLAFLALAGIVTPQQLVRFSRYAIVGAFVVGAVVTPGGDPTAQVVVAAALILLYFISVGLAYVVAPKRPAD